MKAFFTFLACILAGVSLFAQSEATRPVEINVAKLTERLADAPDVFEKSAAHTAPHVELPLPDGGSKRFRMFKTEPMHPDLAAKYPDILSYHGKSPDDGVSTVAITISPYGLRAMISGDDFRQSFIEPVGGIKLHPAAGD